MNAPGGAGEPAGLALVALSLLLTGCASGAIDTNVREGGYRDGSFTGRSQPDDEGAYGEVSLTIAHNDVTAARFVLYLKDGTVKGTSYGTTNGKVVDEATYRRAQNGIAAAPGYAAALVETDDLGSVDAVTGASLTYRQFQEAVTDALRSARS